MNSSEYHKQYHQKRKNDPEYKERRKGVIENMKSRNKKWVDQYKLDKGCVICGYNKSSRALSCHHLDPNTKHNTVSKLCSIATSLNKVKEEVKKCIILCANCHMELHDS